ncbi:MAG TPA: OsmC family protein [Balneolaceae bacterium]|nr:OsmC family protein [Balneolaceae bacterium]
MIKNKANATWEGDIKSGQGNMKVGSGAFDTSYSFGTRFEGKKGTNPEELIGAAHAGCFSMALSLELTEAGHAPDSIETEADVSLDPDSLSISDIKLTTKVSAPDIDDEVFQEIAEGAKKNCPVSKALAGVDISLDAALV